MRTGIVFIYVWIALLLISSCNLFAKIRNGYEGQLYNNWMVFHSLKLRMEKEKNMSPAQRHSLKSEMNDALNYITLYELTEQLIGQLKIIAPQIYYKSDAIRDKKGRHTDIYVKLIPKDSAKIKLIATSYVWQATWDEDLNSSEYGEHSASIEIWLCDQALFLFSHELGHLNYIIPNLASYTDFYNNTYSLKSKLTYVGHNRRDPSGRSAELFQRIFFQDRKEFLRDGGVKPKSPLALTNPIKREIKYSAEHPSEIVEQLKSPSPLWHSLVRRGP